MLGTKQIVIATEKKQVPLRVARILYVNMDRNVAYIHTIDGDIYHTRLTLAEMERQLGEDFLKISRGTLVSAMAVHEVGEQIELSTGELLDYTVRNKREIVDQLRKRQRDVISRLHKSETPAARRAYRAHYRGLDNLPIAFADIKMLFNDEKRAVDWRFCYANAALAMLENVPLEELVGATFGSIFSNMNVKWLRLYERAVLYGESLEVIDHSPEIDADLRVICFPTQKGHCGCLLFPVSGIRFTSISPEGPSALLRYFRALLNSEG